ncbi:homoserine O- acetyltransferase [Tulasnella sp. 418]|nr:homoserine O- acetyltransferase [Tulasnella sp. 418]
MNNQGLSTRFEALIDSQKIYQVPTFKLESGVVLYDVPVAYKTWGKLNDAHDNVMIICHAFTGSADVEDWWGPLMGPGKAFDMTRFFIICLNVMGSPYGTASPLTINPETQCRYGPEFPLTTIRDDVRLHKQVLDHLGVSSIAVVIGGSMGGMAVLEWPLCTEPGYVRNIIPIATSARHSAWCISWGEAQRQSIYSDPAYCDGYYDPITAQPKSGLAAARMAALLTYRSRDSFENRFGRRPQITPHKADSTMITPPSSPPYSLQAFTLHNDGNSASVRRTSPKPRDPEAENAEEGCPKPKIFCAQSYLRYQGDKFTSRFDANCYIHITRKMDTHDVGWHRSRGNPFVQDDRSEPGLGDVAAVLATLPRGALVISIQTDGLFTPSEQQEIAAHIPDASLVTIPSPDGHDGFLLEFELINHHVLQFLRERLPRLYEGRLASSTTGFEIKKTSLFGEAEADIARW